ncbi:MAG: heparinase II/III family protein [Acidobacteria bacterium]|nr:heparinase II/III family protein [Acidobacteriota bacterium]
MSLVSKIRRFLRSEIPPRVVVLEIARRTRAALDGRRERAMLDRAAGDEASARLRPEFARMNGDELLEHFRTRTEPRLLKGFGEAARSKFDARQLFDTHETDGLIEQAESIINGGRWPLLGFGALEFGRAPDWLRDPVSGLSWPLDYHRDVRIVRGDGSDIRIVWELNRLAHLVTLGRAYAATRDHRFAQEFFRQVRHWREHNPVGFGPNWACAMEVALRAVNLLAAFQLFRRAPEMDAANLSMPLALFDEHGAHIRRNLEFSHIATSNHYLSDVAGLFWLGVCLPELEAAREWREFGLREMLREMDKQVLADGADAEASTGYHRLVLELFLYSFILARENGIEIETRYLQTLRAMLEYLRAYLRPDGRAPLVGDTDSGQFLPVARHAADDHAYLLAVGAVFFNEPRFKITTRRPVEVFWLLGEEGVRAFDALPESTELPRSQAFTDAGTYVMRDGDAYLLFNASGAGLDGRGSHGHNDALSVEVSACGVCFIRDPGTFLYTGDLRERQLFRSTAYHSTVEADGAEQNTTDERQPFVIGDEARPLVLRWESDETHDTVVAEHHGYRRLPAGPITHRRAVRFDKRERYWLVEDRLTGAGEHIFRFFFHLAPGLEARPRPDATVEVCDRISGARLLVVSLDAPCAATLEARRSSRDYGEKRASQSACWTIRAQTPLVARWALVPVRAGEAEGERLQLVESLRTDAGQDLRFEV